MARLKIPAKSLTPLLCASLLSVAFFFEASLAQEISPSGVVLGVVVWAIAFALWRKPALPVSSFARRVFAAHTGPVVLLCVFPSPALLPLLGIAFFAKEALLLGEAAKDVGVESRSQLFVDLGLRGPDALRRPDLEWNAVGLAFAVIALGTMRFLPRWSALATAVPFAVFVFSICQFLTIERASESTPTRNPT